MQRRTALRLLACSPLALGSGVGMSGCAPSVHIETQGFLLYGMLIQLSLPQDAPIALEAALNMVERQFKQDYAVIHPWQDSPLTRLNAALPSGDWVQLEPALRPWIEQGARLEKRSDAYFSPAIGGLVKLWGFHSSSPNQERTPPAPGAIASYLQTPPRMSDLEIDGERIRSRNPLLQLDFNAMAEGMVATRLMAEFKAQGIRHALLDSGGDLALCGQAGARAWRVAIQDPFAEGALAALDVSGEAAVFTSGSYRKQFSYQGRRYSHVINPHTGWPAQGLVSVSVIAQDAVLADAAATAMLAAGMEKAPALAAHMGIVEFLLVDEQGRLHASPALAPRLKVFDPDAHPLHQLPPQNRERPA
ncbi:MAG: FAD:protein FMN transferase [Pseudomonadota bacterium]